MKQTAVKWLRKELETIPNYSVFYTNNYQWIDSIMNEAKEMEKEQMINYHKHLIEKFTKLEYTFNTDPKFILENYKKTEQ